MKSLTPWRTNLLCRTVTFLCHLSFGPLSYIKTYVLQAWNADAEWYIRLISMKDFAHSVWFPSCDEAFCPLYQLRYVLLYFFIDLGFSIKCYKVSHPPIFITCKHGLQNINYVLQIIYFFFLNDSWILSPGYAIFSMILQIIMKVVNYSKICSGTVSLSL